MRMDNENNEEENQIEFYRQTWSETDPDHKNIPGVPGWLNFVPNPLFKKFLDRYVQTHDPEKEVFLDVGCGAGRHAVYAAKNGLRSFGIDFSEEAIDHAKRLAEQEGVSHLTEFMVGNVEDLPYRSETFTLVNDSGCFNHILPKQWSGYADGVFSVLKPYGTFRLKAVSWRSLDVWGYDPTNPDRRWFKQTNGVYKYYFKKEELEEIFKAMKIIRLRDRFVSKKNRFFFMIAKKE